MNITMEFIIRLVIAGAMGALIGLDREYRVKKPGIVLISWCRWVVRSL